MAFMEKLGQIANKAVDVAGDSLDYGKAKGKAAIIKGKAKDARETLGAYVYETLKNGGELNMDRIKAFCAEIDGHVAEIERLEEEAKQSGQGITDKITGGKK